MDNVKECLQNTLDCINSVADQDWAFGDRLDHVPSPGLTLKSSGIVGLPLSAQDADRIRREAAPTGGMKRLPRGSCVLDPEQFELRNPAWAQYVQALAERIVPLGKACQVRIFSLALDDAAHTGIGIRS